MAAAEARAGWQRTANRYFSQEDARRAPKLSRAPSSSSSSKSNSGAVPGDDEEANESKFFASNYTPHNFNCNPPSDTKWWLHLQPKFEHHEDFIHEQLNSLEAELAQINRKYESSVDNNCKVDGKHDNDVFFPDQPWNLSADCFKNEHNIKMPELKVVLGHSIDEMAKKMDTGEFLYPDNKQPKNLSSDWESQWTGAEKNEPWWRLADKEDLASMVAQKSLQHIENCDLPRPQTKHIRRGLSKSSLNQNSEMECCSLTNCMQGSTTSVSVDDKHCILGGTDASPLGSDKPYSDNGFENSPTKAQLLEALCHSQTRARKAEVAAQEAYTEKEHILKLVFKQASQIFAFKQWLHLLQLENLCLQLKNKNEPISTVNFPGVPLKKGRHTEKNSKRKRNTCSGMCKCVVAFAVGLTLAGAGLILGWTMGWLFPAF